MRAVTGRRDPLLDSGTRLAMCALLQGATWVEFATTREILEVADSSVSKNARTLEDAGYLEVRKGAVGRRARTWFRLTPHRTPSPHRAPGLAGTTPPTGTDRLNPATSEGSARSRARSHRGHR